MNSREAAMQGKDRSALRQAKCGRRRSGRLLASVVAVAAAASLPTGSLADEGGVSFWLPGIFGSLAAVPLSPGWTVNETYYHWQGQAGADVSAAREITIGRFNPTVTLNLSGNLNALADLSLATAIYAFEQPVLGAQATLGLMTVYGRTDASVNATISGTVGPFPFGPFMRSDFGEAVGFGDLYPQASLRWNKGVDNYMLYVTGDIPVGLYSSSNLANIGIGHGAIDAGGAYTYFNPQTGREFSVTAGLTYNFINPSTQYQNGIDAHVDWGLSQFLTKQFQIGTVGYIYQQVSCDSGSGDRIGCFESRVLGIGPQVGFIFPMETPFGIKQGYLNIRAYAEFDHQNRAQGGDIWVSLTISPPAPTPPPAQPLVRKY
jgi:hypothetical protein